MNSIKKLRHLQVFSLLNQYVDCIGIPYDIVLELDQPWSPRTASAFTTVKFLLVADSYPSVTRATYPVSI